MSASSHRFVITLMLMVFNVACGFASPLNCKLLPLVPPGVEIVSGFVNPHTHRHDQLLLSTHNDRLDLDDWLAITGVDNKRAFEEAVEVAASDAQGGKLSEHLLLVAGRFDSGRIFRAAEMKGAQRGEFEGAPVLLIKPLAREEGEMLDTRWLVILENRIGMLGTPSMVQRALMRYTGHTDIDRALMERLSRMREDVSSWNVLVSEKNMQLLPGSRTADLLEDAGVLTMGVSFGQRVRVDFSFYASGLRGAEFLKHKAASFAEVFSTGATGKSRQRCLRSFRFEANQVQGSVELSWRQFEVWREQINLPRPQEALARVTAREE
jgi:hypothetical protein